jgi:hypothetical protein
VFQTQSLFSYLLGNWYLCKQVFRGGINSVFERLWESRRLHPRNFLAAHLNINSHRYKFDEIKELLSDKIVDIFFVAESKTKMTEVLIVTFGQNMVFLYRYGCTSQVRPVIAKVTL